MRSDGESRDAATGAPSSQRTQLADSLIVALGASAGGLEAFRAFLSAMPSDSGDRKSTRLNSSHVERSYAVFCLKNKILQLLHRHGSTHHPLVHEPLAWPNYARAQCDHSRVACNVIRLSAMYAPRQPHLILHARA